MSRRGTRDHDRVDAADHSDHPIQIRGASPGSPMFGEQARLRRESLQRRAEAGDLRLVTAGRTARTRRENVNKILAGD